MHNLQTILFDADGVLQHPTTDYRTEFAELLGSRQQDAPQFIAEVFAAERPTLCGVGDFRDALAALLPRRNIPKDVDQVLSIWTQIKPDRAVFEAISTLRTAGIRCCLATNQQSYRAQVMSETLGYSRCFDREFYSCRVGFAKPEAAYFRFILDDLGCAAEHTLFIDDHEANVVAARGVGLHGAVFVATPQNSVEMLREILTEHGLALS